MAVQLVVLKLIYNCRGLHEFSPRSAQKWFVPQTVNKNGLLDALES